MNIKVIKGDVRNATYTATKLEEWLTETGDVHIEHTQAIGPDPESCAFQLVIFYRDRKSTPDVQPPPGQLCRQCKKRPAIPGQRQCTECKEYQRKYREQKKAEKKAIYP